ncbi:hypothetical protein HDU98_008219 [Podochytrium sp. JEL0797]|nr:hypothetical protein HDU98_008219 [Podochytrium sp. JEL0797]
MRGNVEAADDVLRNQFAQCGVEPNRTSFEKLIVGHLTRWVPKRPVGPEMVGERVLDPVVEVDEVREQQEFQKLAEVGGFETEDTELRVLAGESDSDLDSAASLGEVNESELLPESAPLSSFPESDSSTTTNIASSIVPQPETERVEDLELKGIRRAVQLFNEMLESGFTPTVIIFDVFMRSHYRRGEHDRVLELFETMKREGVTPDRHIYTVLIETLAVGMKNMSAARRALTEMETTLHLPADIHIHTIFMNGHLRLNDPESSKRIFAHLLANKLTPSLHTYGTLIHTLCRAGETDEAHHLVTHEIPRLFDHPANHVMYNTLLHGYGLKGDLEATRRVLNEMAGHNLPPLITTFNILLSSHVRHGDSKGAWNWYQAILASGLTPTLVTYNILIHMHLKDEDPLAAQEMYKNIVTAGLIPDTATIVPMVDYYTRRGEWDAVVGLIENHRAMGTIEGAQFSGKGRGRVAYSGMVPQNVVLEHMRKDGNLAGVVRRFAELTNPPPPAPAPLDDDAAVGVDSQSVAGGEEPAVSAAATTAASTDKLDPTVETYDILIRSLGALKDFDAARYWLDVAIRRNEVDTRLFNTMLTVYVNAFKVEEAKEVYAMIEANGLIPDPVSVTLLFKATSLPPRETDEGVGSFAAEAEEY